MPRWVLTLEPHPDYLICTWASIAQYIRYVRLPVACQRFIGSNSHVGKHCYPIASLAGISEDHSASLEMFQLSVMAEYICGANVYQNEQSEEWVGEWAEACQNRDSLVLAAKFTMDYRGHAIGKGPRAANFGGNSRHTIYR